MSLPYACGTTFSALNADVTMEMLTTRLEGHDGGIHWSNTKDQQESCLQ